MYVPMFIVMMQMPQAQAKKEVCDIIRQIKEEQKKEGTDNIPENFGDYLLEKEKTDEKTKIKFAKKRQEGVQDQDIKWWFNMHDLERRMLLKIDDLTRMTMFTQFLQDGKNEKEAVTEIHKYQPIYGDSNDNTHTSGEDRPLPYELKDRINKCVESSTFNTEQFKVKILKSPTFNAFIREQIRNNNL